MPVLHEYQWLVVVGAICAFGFGWGTGVLNARCDQARAKCFGDIVAPVLACCRPRRTVLYVSTDHYSTCINALSLTNDIACTQEQMMLPTLLALRSAARP